MTVGGYQFVWWGCGCWEWGSLGPYPNRPGTWVHAKVYVWRFGLGPLEIRKWFGTPPEA